MKASAPRETHAIHAEVDPQPATFGVPEQNIGSAATPPPAVASRTLLPSLRVGPRVAVVTLPLTTPRPGPPAIGPPITENDEIVGTVPVKVAVPVVSMFAEFRQSSVSVEPTTAAAGELQVMPAGPTRAQFEASVRP